METFHRKADPFLRPGYALKCVDSCCDVTFLVGPTHNAISAHKCVLANGSPVFRAMLNGNLPENSEISLPDVDQDVFQMFLRYLYKDEIDITEDNVVPLLYISRKYMVDALVDVCQQVLVSMVTEENVVCIFNLAEMFCLNCLQKHCLRFMKKSLHNVAKSEDFINLDFGEMTQIVRRLDLVRLPTYIAFCLRHWYSTECSRRDLPVFDETFLNLLVSEIQFNTISGKLFIDSFRHPSST